MIPREEFKRLRKLSTSRLKLDVPPGSGGPKIVYEAEIVDSKGRRKTIGQLASSSSEARRKLEYGGAKVLRVRRLKGLGRKELAFAVKHPIYNGRPYRA